MRPEPTRVEHFIVARDRNDSQARLDLKGFAKDKRSSLFLHQHKRRALKNYYEARAYHSGTLYCSQR